MNRVEVDAEQCNVLGEFLKKLSFPGAQEEVMKYEIPDRVMGNLYFAMVAICHQTTPHKGPALQGNIDGKLRRGWDYLREKMIRATEKDPDIVSPTFTYATNTYYFDTNPANYITATTSSLTNYVSTSTLTTDLLAYLSTTSAAATYLPLSASTSLPYIPFASSSLYYLNSNPAGFVTATTSSLTNYTTSTTTAATYPTFTYASSTYLPFASSSLYYLNSNPAGYVTATTSALTNYVSTSTLTTDLLAYLSTTSAASTYLPLSASTSLPYIPFASSSLYYLNSNPAGFVTATTSSLTNYVSTSTFTTTLLSYLSTTSAASTYLPLSASTSLAYIPSASSSLYLLNSASTSLPYLASTTPFSAGYIPYATTSGALTNSVLYESGTNGGLMEIGTTTATPYVAQTNLYVNGALEVRSTTANGLGGITNIGASGSNLYPIFQMGTVGQPFSFYIINNGFWQLQTVAQDLRLAPNGVTDFDAATANGYIGLTGVTNPQTALNLAGGDVIAIDLSTPNTPTGTASTTGGGTFLATSTWVFKITALDASGNPTLSSAYSATTTTTTATSSVIVSWSAVTGAASYRIYYATSSSLTAANYFTTALTTYNFATTSGNTAGALPTVTTAYVDNVSPSGSSWFNGGNVGIGTTTPTYALTIAASSNGQIEMEDTASTTVYWVIGSAASSTTNQFDVFNQNNQGLYIVNGATSWTAASDERLKTNVTPLGTSTLDEILSLNPVTFNWIATSSSQAEQVGFIAQQVASSGLSDIVVVPANPNDCVPGDSTQNDCYGLDYDRFAPYLVKAIQVQQGFIETIETFINNISNGIAHLANIFVQELTVGTSDTPTTSGITMYDHTTGAAYCVFINNGTWTNTQGVCGTQSSSESAGGDGSTTSIETSGDASTTSPDDSSSTSDIATSTDSQQESTSTDATASSSDNMSIDTSATASTTSDTTATPSTDTSTDTASSSSNE